MAMLRRDSEHSSERKESKQVVSRLEKEKDSKAMEYKRMFRSDGIFMLGARREKVRAFFDTVRPDATEVILDFDGTLTAPDSANAYHVALRTGQSPTMEGTEMEGFKFRKGAIAFVRLLQSSGFTVKIHSMGFSEVIHRALALQGLDFPRASIFGNDLSAPKTAKSSIPIDLDEAKNHVIIGDSPADFAFDTPNDSVRIGFASKKSGIWINEATDFYHLENAGDYIHLYHLFRRFYEEKSTAK